MGQSLARIARIQKGCELFVSTHVVGRECRLRGPGDDRRIRVALIGEDGGDTAMGLRIAWLQSNEVAQGAELDGCVADGLR